MTDWLGSKGVAHNPKSKKAILVDLVWSALDRGVDDTPTDIDGTSNAKPARYPELTMHGMDQHLKTWFYAACRARSLAQDDNAKLVAEDIRNAALHWCGHHETCATNDSQRQCVKEGWGVRG
eukprot:TRINITY_DN6361_c0_g2_i1.p1 TRINITY_DN6361_c0_g2~~TRINITY_DN6361_c0_g2_i1.p1  ORF type:complete len:122 (-),score=10.64 TRINITY_DN6361_c0_g2_i1:40-405(-)